MSLSFFSGSQVFLLKMAKHKKIFWLSEEGLEDNASLPLPTEKWQRQQEPSFPLAGG